MADESTPKVTEPQETAAETAAPQETAAPEAQTTPESTPSPNLDPGGRPLPDQGPPPAAEASTDGTTAAESTEPVPFFQAVASLGDGFEGIEDEQTAQQRLLERYQATQQEREQVRQQVGQMRQFAEDGRRFQQFLQSPEYQRYREYAQSQQQPAAQATQAAQPQQPEDNRPSWWRPPKFDSDLLPQYVRQNPETGDREWIKDGSGNILAPPEFRNQVMQYEAYRDKWANNLTTKPDEVLPPIIEDIAKKVFTELYQHNRQTEDVVGFVQNVSQENADWMYEHNPDGSIAQQFNPAAGRYEPRWTQHGAMVNHFVKEATATGIQNPKARWDYATKMAHYEILRGQTGQPTAQQPAAVTQQPAAQTPADPAAVAAQKKQEHAARVQRHPGANASPNTSGSIPRAEVPGDSRQNDRPLTFDQILKREMSNNGLSEVPIEALVGQ